jgi:hypothetical protein
MLTDAEIRAVLDRAADRVGHGDRVSVFPDRPEDAETSLTADGWRTVDWLVDHRTDATYDVLWHAERGEGRLRPWREGPMGWEPPGRP